MPIDLILFLFFAWGIIGLMAMAPGPKCTSEKAVFFYIRIFYSGPIIWVGLFVMYCLQKIVNKVKK